MTLFTQLFWGSVFLGVCAVIQVLVIGYAAGVLLRLGNALERRSRFLRVVSLVSIGFGIITLAHTAQVWIWAKAFLAMGVIEDLNGALYFAFATYTTVGYGDLVLGPGTRIFGTFAGMSGILSLGVSTAFLVAVLSRLLKPTDPKDGGSQ